MTSLKDNLIKKIKQGEIDMAPRWHFVLKTVLMTSALIIVALIAVYLLSFLMFALQATGLSMMPWFGIAGIIFFVVSSPWILIMFVGIFLGILYMLVSRYSFSYQTPLVYSMIGVVLGVIAVSSLIEQTVFHSRVHSYVREHNVPGIAPMYRGFAEKRPDEVTIGRVTNVTEQTLTVQTDENTTLSVHLNARTKRPRTSLKVGERILIFGNRNGSDIEAFGVRPIGERFTSPSGFPPPKFQQRNFEHKQK